MGNYSLNCVKEDVGIEGVLSAVGPGTWPVIAGTRKLKWQDRNKVVETKIDGRC